MPRANYCRICEFFKKPYRQNERMTFEKLAREGTSFRRLEVFFQALNLKVKKDAIRKHISICMDIQVAQQRQVEKEIKRKGISKISQKLGFFTRPKEEPQVAKPCSHAVTYPFYSVAHERVFIKCSQCGEILTKFGIDPHETEKRQKKDPRNLEIYRSLTRK